jgi:hypothetical protein
VPLVKRDSPRILHQTLNEPVLVNVFCTCSSNNARRPGSDARINKQVVQKIIVRPDGGKAQAMAVLNGQPKSLRHGLPRQNLQAASQMLSSHGQASRRAWR